MKFREPHEFTTESESFYYWNYTNQTHDELAEFLTNNQEFFEQLHGCHLFQSATDTIQLIDGEFEL